MGSVVQELYFTYQMSCLSDVAIKSCIQGEQLVLQQL
jgi:hypothetical protein